MSLPATQKRILLVKRPVDGKLTQENFKLSEDKIDTNLNEGEALVRTIYISLDPTLRNWTEEHPPYTPQIPLGNVMSALGIGQVVSSKNPDWKEGDLLTGAVGFQEYAILKENEATSKVNDIPKFPLHVALNNFGITGLTAYFGLTKKGEPKEGETLLVSGAAGATGLAVGHIGKIYGCRVVGIAGSDEKCKNLTEKYGFDGAINYKNADVGAEIKKQCPKGVDVYFDNVGGPLLDTVLTKMNFGGRVVLCGAISQYNAKEGEVYGIKNTMHCIFNEIQMRGIFLTAHRKEYHEAAKNIHQWLEEGKMPVLPVTLHKGFEKILDAFFGLFSGHNEGKTLVEVSAPPAPYHD